MISDEDVWNYGQAVRKMVKDHGFDKNLKVVHAMQILGMIDPSTTSIELTEEIFYQTIDSSRDVIKDRYCQPLEVTKKLVDEDIDSRLTYNGMKTFVKIDLENTSVSKNAASKKDYLKEMSTLALTMMGRSEGFGHLIRAAMPHHIRLSIHPSYGTAKLSICLVPQLPGFTARAPWMSCIATGTDGAHQTAHAKDVRITHQLIYENGMPWKYVERETLPLPENILSRNAMFEDLWQQNVKALESKPREEIKVIIDIGDGSALVTAATSWESTPTTLLSHLPENTRGNVLIAKVNHEHYWDLNRTFEKDCTLEFLTFDHPEAQQAFWRSSASCLAELCEQEYQCTLVDCTTTTQGLFCDMKMPAEYVLLSFSGKLTLTHKRRAVTEADRELLNKRVVQLSQKSRGFERLEVSKETLEKMFSFNKYKLHAISDMAEGQMATVYRCGTFVDISDGPHILSTTMIKAFKVFQVRIDPWFTFFPSSSP